METELSKIFLTETNGNEILFNRILFPFPFADCTNGIPDPIKACGSMWQLTKQKFNRTFKISFNRNECKQNFQKNFLTETNGNGIPLNGILFNGILLPFLFADCTYGIPQAV